MYDRRNGGRDRGAARRGGPRPGEAPLSLLLEAVLSIGSDLELRAMLQQIVDTATELTGARYGALGVLDPERGTIGELYTAGLDDTEGRRTDPCPFPFPDGCPEPSPREDPGRPVLGAPIRVHDQDFGTLCLTGKHTGGFTDPDAAVLRALASQAGIAIANARLYKAARQRERWIEGAAAVTTALLTGGARPTP